LCSSVIFTTLFSNAPANIPGNTNTLFNWLGKSDLPVAMIFAHAFFAISGIISGVGFAIANIIESGFIVCTISHVKTHGAETQINTSAQTTASFNFQYILDLLVILEISCFSLFKSVLFSETIHLLSHTIISHNQ